MIKLLIFYLVLTQSVANGSICDDLWDRWYCKVYGWLLTIGDLWPIMKSIYSIIWPAVSQKVEVKPNPATTDKLSASAVQTEQQAAQIQYQNEYNLYQNPLYYPQYAAAQYSNIQTQAQLGSDEITFPAHLYAGRRKRRSSVEEYEYLFNSQKSPLTCETLECLCQHMLGKVDQRDQCLLPNGQPLRSAIRKEYRQLTKSEREEFQRALADLREIGFYTEFSNMLKTAMRRGVAQNGPTFVLWHKELLKRLEIALRLANPELALPYWDPVLDRNLPDPRSSIIWSRFLFGATNQNDEVVNGPFVKFNTSNGKSLSRKLSAIGTLPTAADIGKLFQGYDPNQIYNYATMKRGCRTAKYTLENIYNSIREWTTGHATEKEEFASDPVFFLAHTFIDSIFEDWRIKYQPANGRAKEYTKYDKACRNGTHSIESEMIPFNMTIADGLSAANTNNLYKYAAKPTCGLHADCGSEFLFCNKHSHDYVCASKIRVNGSCKGLEGRNACHQGICVDGYCRPANRFIAIF